MAQVLGTNNPDIIDALYVDSLGASITNGADTVLGFDDDDSIFGLGGADLLKGGGGADDLHGGSGVDTADYSDATGSLTVSLLTGTGASNVAAGDTLFSIENLNGGAHGDILIGNNFVNVLQGREGGDTLSGEGGADTLNGETGNDVLKGGGGADTLNGGIGVDTASYSNSTAGVFVSRMADTASGGYAEGDELNSIENLTGSDFSDFLYGNNSANVLRGLEGSDTLRGFNGIDTLHGSEGNDTLKGGGGADTLNGNSGVDTADYSESTSGVNVRLISDFAAGGHAAGDELNGIENLTGSGFGDQLWGNDGVNTLAGGNGADTLKGYGGADTLLGGNAADHLFGLVGADTTNGGAGSDWHYVENSGDTVVEAVAGGNDHVVSSVTYTLAAAAEVEFLATTNKDLTDAINFTGNSFDNDIRANDGMNTLNGKGGNDLLIGYGDNDAYRFDTTLNGLTNFDEIINFAPNVDVIELDDDIFNTFDGPGVLLAGRFRIGPDAADGNDRIIYDDTTGEIFFDADGTGATDKVRFALVGEDLALDNADFLVVA